MLQRLRARTVALEIVQTRCATGESARSCRRTSITVALQPRQQRSHRQAGQPRRRDGQARHHGQADARLDHLEHRRGMGELLLDLAVRSVPGQRVVDVAAELEDAQLAQGDIHEVES